MLILPINPAFLLALSLANLRKNVTGMIEWLAYLFSGAVIAGIGAFIFGLFKVGPGKPEFAFWKAIAGALAITWVGPFAYVEVLTKIHRDDVTPVVQDYFDSSDCPLKGKIKYIKVLYQTDKVSYVYLVGDEPQDWGGNDSPVVKLTLKKQNSKISGKFHGWEVSKFKILRSDRLQKDSLVWPPYQ